MKVAHRLSEVTILATFSRPGASIQYMHQDGSGVMDLDPSLEGYQVRLTPGSNYFVIEAIEPNGEARHTYKVMLLRNTHVGNILTLVSNIDQSDFSPGFYAPRPIAQYFSTPDEEDGFEIHSIKIRTRGYMPSFDLEIYSVDDNLDVSERLFGFERPDRRGLTEPEFFAPPDAVLDPGLTYAVVPRGGRLVQPLRFDVTSSNLEGEKLSPDWKIADRYHLKQGARWVRSDSNRSLRISIEGTKFVAEPQQDKPEESAPP